MAKTQFKLEGLRKITAELNKEIVLIKGRSLAGLISASIIVRRRMSSTPPIVPRDTRNLDHSWFVVTAKSTEDGKSPSFVGKDSGEMASGHSAIISREKAMMQVMKIPVLSMGFSANYAIYVHEIVGETKKGKKIEYKHPNAGPKFFQAALEGSRGEILETIRQHAKIR